MSTGTTNKGEAKVIAQRAGEVGSLARNGQLTPEKARRVADDIVSAVLRSIGHKTEGMAIRAYLNSWVREKEHVGAESTFVSYTGIIAKFLSHLGHRADESLATLGKADVLAFRDSLVGRLSASRVNNYLKVLRVALNRAVREQLIERNPASLVDNFKTQARSSRRAFTIAEILKLLDSAHDDWRTMILFALYTGLRLQDVANLTWENLDLQRKELTVCTGKTGRMVIIPITKPLLSHIESLNAGDDPKMALCPNLKGKQSSWLSNQFYQLMASAKLVPERTHQKGVEVELANKTRHKGWIAKDTKTELHLQTPAGVEVIQKAEIKSRISAKGRDSRRSFNEIGFHALRHTTTSWMKNAGVSGDIVKDIVGHESEAVSRNYTHIETETKRRALNAMPDVVKLYEQPELGFSHEQKNRHRQ